MPLCSHALRRALILTGALSLLARTPVAQAQDPARGVSLGLTYRAGQKMSLLVLPVDGAAGDSVATILARDLDFSDRFTMVPASGAGMTTGPVNYPLLAKLGVDGVVQGTLLPSGWLRITLLDVAKKAIVNQKDLPLPVPTGSPAWRLAVHGAADQLQEWLIGERGIAQTRIAFTRDGRLWTVDSDGANVRPVTPAGMSPAWLPNGRGLVYSVLDGVRNPIMMTDLTTGAQRVITSAPQSQDLTPVPSPDGRSVVFARVSEVGTDLFSIPFEGGAPRRLTVGRGRASVQPAFSPDGQRLVFSSDRSGTNDVYICDVDGTNVEVLSAATFGDRSNRTGPDWSPDGRLIAFQSLNGNTKQIMTLNLRDQSVRAVATDGRNDDPSWAPDSRHLVITSDRSAVRQLWVVDIETGRSRQLTFGTAARLSAWSPRLQLP